MRAVVSIAFSHRRTGDAMRYGFLALLLMISPAAAQTPMACEATDKLNQRLASEYGESITSAGISPGGIIYVTSNPESGTFSIILRRNDGQSCILIGGIGYATIEAIQQGRDL